jgi:hypothetical protein
MSRSGSRSRWLSRETAVRQPTIRSPIVLSGRSVKSGDHSATYRVQLSIFSRRAALAVRLGTVFGRSTQVTQFCRFERLTRLSTLGIPSAQRTLIGRSQAVLPTRAPASPGRGSNGLSCWSLLERGVSNELG